ncbi:MAG: glycosyltransferase, partial [Candidatus Bathyarchaeia archaeon]
MRIYVFLVFVERAFMGKRRAAVVFPSLNYLGGAVRVCLEFINILFKAGYEVSLFTVDKIKWSLVKKIFGDFGDLHFKEYFVISDFPRFFNTMLRNIFLTLFYVLEVFVVRFLLGFDVVFVVGGELVDCVGDVVYVNTVPFRLEHTLQNTHLGKSVVWKCYSKIYDVFLKFLGKVNSRRLLVSNSCFLRDVILKNLGESSIVIHPPVDIDKFMVSEENEGERLNVVVTVSRIHPGKSLNTVLEVAKRVDGARFLIIGSSSGRFEETLRELNGAIEKMSLKNKIDVLVNEPLSKLVKTLFMAKVLLHTQPSEAFGMVVVEAMAAGCVPVVPRSGGPWIDIL